jgi:hypothetical protein
MEKGWIGQEELQAQFLPLFNLEPRTSYDRNTEHRGVFASMIICMYSSFTLQPRDAIQ